MLLKGLSVLIIMSVGLVISTSMMAGVNETMETARSRAVQETNLSCNVPVDKTSCTFTLAEASQYTSTTQMTITETSPGSNVNRTNASSVGSDRKTITVTGLVASTNYLFTTDFKGVAAGVDNTTSQVMALLPLLIVFGVLIISMLWLLSSLGVLDSA